MYGFIYFFFCNPQRMDESKKRKKKNRISENNIYLWQTNIYAYELYQVPVYADKIFHQVQVCLIPHDQICLFFAVFFHIHRLPSFYFHFQDIYSTYREVFFLFLNYLTVCILFSFIDLFAIFDRNFWILNSQCNCYFLCLWLAIAIVFESKFYLYNNYIQHHDV